MLGIITVVLVPPVLQSGASTSGLSQPFNLCSACSRVGSSWTNMAIYSSDFKPLVNPRFVVTVAQQLQENDTRFGANHWTLQVNCNSPVGFSPSYQQFVVSFDGDAGISGVIAFIAKSDAFLGSEALTGALVGGNYNPLPSGSQITVSVQTNSTNSNTVGMQLGIVAGGNQIVSDFLRVTSIPGWQESWSAPVSSCNVEMVGWGIGSTASFSAGSGTITYIPSGGQTYLTVNPGSELGTGNPYWPFPTQLNLQRVDQHTSERSNMFYDPVNGTTITSTYTVTTSQSPSSTTTPTQVTTTTTSTAKVTTTSTTTTTTTTLQFTTTTNAPKGAPLPNSLLAILIACAMAFLVGLVVFIMRGRWIGGKSGKSREAHFDERTLWANRWKG